MGLPSRLGRRIGILGGTFDPVHAGHLAIARAAQARFSLDLVLFVPAAQPPHKLRQPLAPFADRVRMLELALAGQPGLALTEMEKERAGPSYSIDTLRELRQGLGEEVRLFFLIGMDAFVEITTWKQHAELFRYAEFVVIGRPDVCGEELPGCIARDFPGFRAEDPSSWVSQDGRGRIHSLAMASIAVSATGIRRRVAGGENFAGLVPEAVREYITRHGLYRASSPGK